MAEIPNCERLRALRRAVARGVPVPAACDAPIYVPGPDELDMNVDLNGMRLIMDDNPNMVDENIFAQQAETTARNVQKHVLDSDRCECIPGGNFQI